MKMRRLPQLRRNGERRLRLTRVGALIKSALRLGIYVLALLCVGGAMGYWSWQYPKRLWRTENRVAVAILQPSGELCLVSVQPQENLTTTLKMPGSLRTPLIRGYGKYRLEVVDQLGAQEGRGAALLSESLEHWLGVVILDTFRTKAEVGCSEVGEIRGVILGTKSDKGMNVWDRIRIWQVLGAVEVQHWQSLDVEAEGGVSKTMDPSGQEQSELTSKGLEQVRLWLRDEALSSQDMAVAVVNQTSESGLAAEASNVLVALGYDVVINTNDPENGASEILVDALVSDRPEAVWPLEQLFPFPIRVVDGLTQEYRAELVVRLGYDYSEMVRGK